MKIDGWFEKKRYKHFDSPVDKKTAFSIVSDPKKVIKHSFFPFISFDVKSIKYQYDEELGKKKPTLKKRPICYCSHMDSHIYSYYGIELIGKYEDLLKEKRLEHNVLAFRKIIKYYDKEKNKEIGKCNIDYAFEAFEEIQKYKEPVVIALDFTKFFDTLDHTILKKQWSQLLNTKKLPEDHYKIFKSLTNFTKVKKNDLENIFCREKNFKSNRICTSKEFRDIVRKKDLIKPNDNKNELNEMVGIPQGSPLSGLLSNIYMIDFDIKMKTFIEKLHGKYYRYCDDMLIIIPHHNLIKKILNYAQNSIKALKVKINNKKTEIRIFNRNKKLIKIKSRLIKNKKSSIKTKTLFDKQSKLYLENAQVLQYLGFVFDGNNSFIRSSSISRYHDKMRRGIRRAKAHMHKRNKERKKDKIKSKELYKKNIYELYSYQGNRNFITYCHRAKKNMNNSKTIKKQIKRFNNILYRRLNKWVS